MQNKNGKIVKQIMQYKNKGDVLEYTRIGSLYENTSGQQRGIIDLNTAEENPKGDERYLNFILVDPIEANNIRNRQYSKNSRIKEETVLHGQ